MKSTCVAHRLSVTKSTKFQVCCNASVLTNPSKAGTAAAKRPAGGRESGQTNQEMRVKWCRAQKGGGHCVRAKAAQSGGAAGASHDDPRSPNVHFGGPPALQKHHRNSTKRRPERAQRVKFQAGRRTKKAQNFGWTSTKKVSHLFPSTFENTFIEGRLFVLGN